jgi:diguanylate cyclase (GGDEF)-like protein/PAS domain S-box-containing protein
MSIVDSSLFSRNRATVNFRTLGWLFAAIWSGVLAFILMLDYVRGQAAVQDIALIQARAHYNKDVAFRLWATSHGRIYVPISELMTPDEHLAQLPERDITTPAGQRLTMINPASMVRQLNEEFGELYGITGRITSLQPIRKENAPDNWERAALEAFDQGSEERIESNWKDGQPHLRLMRPIMMAPGCLMCHSTSGRQVGEVAGAVGVNIPLSGLLAKERERFLADVISVSVILLSGLLLLGYTFRRMLRNQQQRLLMMEELRRSEARKGSIMASALDSIITMDHQGMIVEFNPTAEKVFGHARDQVVGRELAEVLIPPSLRDLHRKGLEHAVSSSDSLGSKQSKILGRRVETSAICADGREIPVELTVTCITLDGQAFFTAYLRDLTEARRLEERISFQATHDELTGLFNRSEFERRINQLLEESILDEEHAVLILDLDQFRVVNDTGGHGAGDMLLQQIARMIHSKTHTGDVLARLGSDEFGLLLEGCSLKKAEAVGRELLKVIRINRLEWEGQRFNVTASVGVVPVGKHSHSVSDVMSAANTACNVAKEQGRNRIHLFRHDDVELGRRQGEMRWIGRIHDAFESGRFSLYYQPLQPLFAEADERPWHYEILLRMRDEDGKFVPPPTFLSAAERYSLMPTIDRWVVRSTLSWLAGAPEHLEQLSLCSINLSGHSVTDENFLAFLRDQFRLYPVPADRICFEITETAAVSHLGKAARFIEVLKESGCRFALDDFGSGMSSFGYLKNLPVDFLKIDGSFVRDIVDNEINLAMVRSINDIGHVMGKLTIAEFVEDKATLEKLRLLGVDYAQGYGIGRPAPLAELGSELNASETPLAG